MALPTWNNQQVIDQLNSGYIWGSTSLSYTFPTSSKKMIGGAEKRGFSPLNGEQQAKATLALQVWDDVSAIDFYKINAASANIDFGNSNRSMDFAHAYYPQHGSVWFNKAAPDLQAPAIGGHGFLTFVHELGHTLGLDHMGAYNGAGNWTPSSYQDSTVYSIMSYFGPSWGGGADNGEGLVAWADWTSRAGVVYNPQTPMINDLLALHAMYGAETSTRNDDTTYGFGSTDQSITKAIYDFTLNLNPILCLYDTGGNDTLNLSGWSTSCEINLAPGTFSSANDMTYNISIDYNTFIENATGGSGNDLITGNDLGNTIKGLSGADVIDGGGGVDTVVYQGAFADYSVTKDFTSNIITVQGGADGIDKLRGVELLQFSDTTIDAGQFFDPSTYAGVAAKPFASLSAAEATVTEGTGTTTDITFTITLDNASTTDLAFDYQISNGGDYTTETFDFAGALTGSVVVAAGALTGTLIVSVTADEDYERNEDFGIIISSAATDVIVFDNMASATILNDDALPTVITGNKRANYLSGTDGGNDIYGLKGNDTLDGRGGKDYLNGGVGNDWLTGGAGEDGFGFTDAKFGRDIITDFVDGLDYLAFSSRVADAVTDFVIAGNDTSVVTLYIGKNSVVINGTGPIHLDADDFSFF